MNCRKFSTLSINKFLQTFDAQWILFPNKVLALRQCEKNGEVKCNSTEGPAGWASSFEKLLEDPLGLHTFAEFLKKEFSAENIYFWTACERYKRLPSGAERFAEARRIYQQHLCVGAPEPVNVDSQARQCAEPLEDADSALFSQAQKQIFNLMKFDSYPRFLKSDLYKQCVSGNLTGSQLDTSLLLQPMSASKLKKSLSNAEDRRRKSLLPWHRKNRSKSKDRGETEYVGRSDGFVEGGMGQKKGVEMHGSRSSLTSLDLAMSSTMQDNVRGSQDELSGARSHLCRVILNNGTTTIVQIKDAESIHHFISRLLEKRGLSYSAFEVYTDKHHKAVDVNEQSMKLAGCEVTVEQRVVFKLDLPNRKIIAVKSKYTKILIDVLRPILHKYNYNLEQVKISLRESGEIVNIHLPVTSVDGQRLNVQLQEDYDERTETKQKLAHTLEEITNRVYEDILQGKSDATCSKPKSDKGSVKSEDWGSEHSSGIFGRFLRSNSAMHERKKKGVAKAGLEEGSSEHMSVCKKPLIAKWKTGVKLQVACSESDELYEGLSRAQRARLEDQRGTEINFELPDFLKDKENEQRKAQSEDASPIPVEQTHNSPPKTIPLNYENVILNNELSPRTFQQAKVNNIRRFSPSKMSADESGSSNQSTPSKNGSFDKTVIENKVSRSCEPPPLPPKPKILPAKPSNWGQPHAYFKVPIPGKRTLYLEPSTSSFV